MKKTVSSQNALKTLPENNKERTIVDSYIDTTKLQAIWILDLPNLWQTELQLYNSWIDKILKSSSTMQEFIKNLRNNQNRVMDIIKYLPDKKKSKIKQAKKVSTLDWLSDTLNFLWLRNQASDDYFLKRTMNV